MNEHLRDRILRKMETLSDERGYQVLDYVEFLESRYAERRQSVGERNRRDGGFHESGGERVEQRAGDWQERGD